MATCARRAGHAQECRTAQALEDHRQRKTERRWGQTLEAAEDRARWRKSSKFTRYGLAEVRFNQMLEDQGYACAICREPFTRQLPRVDHDHNCCKVPPNGVSRSCGECVRGLLCVRCNTWLGWLEKYGGGLVHQYLGRPAS
jgi:hypothetical protein